MAPTEKDPAMPATSEARIRANQQNAQRSTGPKTDAGKARSRANAYKHGLAGDGVVLRDEDSLEVERRTQALQREMAPTTELGAILVRKIAVTSVVSERATRQEFAATAERVRHAPERFDAERLQRARTAFDALPEQPREGLRQLKAMPEGVELLLQAWRDLRAGLTRSERRRWGNPELLVAARLLGVPQEDARASEIGRRSVAFWAEFKADDPGHQDESRAKVVELIDQTIAELEAHASTLDVETIAVDRAEAGGRALFDGSIEASRARRYEADASRGFYKAIREFRQVEAEAAERAAASVEPESPPSLGSFREEDRADESESEELPPEHLRTGSSDMLEHLPLAVDASDLARSFQSASLVAA
jgi:hypothetical protein